jgi:membrane-bound metal-dependent hydrolase YbcI (DUF457 family)
MYAAGHLALGYLMGFATSKVVRRTVHLPLLFLVAILPDIDYLLPDVMHRGPTHSLVLHTILAIPFLLIYRRRALPYLVALWGHGISDLFDIAGVQLFWPLSTYNHPLIPYRIILQTDPLLVPAEVFLTGSALLVMVGAGSFWRLMAPDLTVLFLLGPMGALAASLRIFRLPSVLIASQWIIIGVFTLSFLQFIRYCIMPPYSTDTSSIEG